MPNPVELSPAIDLRTDKVVVIMQDRPVVGMSAWLVDALAAAEADGPRRAAGHARRPRG